MQSQEEPALSHVSPKGEAKMVDVSEKAITRREARASALIELKAPVADALMAGSLPKGDALATARIAGIQAAKRASELIPLCHPLPLDWVGVEFTRVSATVIRIECRARSISRTGVEMEAMTGVSVAALTLYDMAKSADKAMVIGPIRLEYKSGGKSGTFERDAEDTAEQG